MLTYQTKFLQITAFSISITIQNQRIIQKDDIEFSLNSHVYRDTLQAKPIRVCGKDSIPLTIQSLGVMIMMVLTAQILGLSDLSNCTKNPIIVYCYLNNYQLIHIENTMQKAHFSFSHVQIQRQSFLKHQIILLQSC